MVYATSGAWLAYDMVFNRGGVHVSQVLHPTGPSRNDLHGQ